MSPLIDILLITVCMALQANAATHMVTVGQGGALAFNPSEIKAAMGDTITFTFAAGGNHSVVEGDFGNACQPATSGGFFSGYMIDADSFSITVNTTDPIPFYCSQSVPPHCPFGMVGVINPSGSNTQANFAASAKNAKTVGAPANVFGGTVGGSSSGGGSSTSSAAPAATTSPAAGGNGGGGPYGGGGSNSGAGTVAASVGGIVAAVGFALYMA